MQPLVTDMVQDDPNQRLTIDEVVIRLRRYGKALAAGNSVCELSNAKTPQSLVSIVLSHTGTAVSHSLWLGSLLYPKLISFMYANAAIGLEIERSVRLGVYRLRSQTRPRHTAPSSSYLLTMGPRALIPNNSIMLSHSQKGILRLRWTQSSVLAIYRILYPHGRHVSMFPVGVLCVRHFLHYWYFSPLL